MSYRSSLFILLSWASGLLTLTWPGAPGPALAIASILPGGGSAAAIAQAETTAPATANPVYLMELGTEGPGVESVQRKLQAAGYYDGEISGTYDAETEAAVRWFQEVVELPVTGGIDFATWKAVQASLPQSAPANRPGATGSEPEGEPTDAAEATSADPTESDPPADPETELPLTDANTDDASTDSSSTPASATLPAAGPAWPRFLLWGAIAASSSIALLGSILYVFRLLQPKSVDPEGDQSAGEPPIPAPPKVTVTPAPPRSLEPAPTPAISPSPPPATSNGGLQASSPNAAAAPLQRINILEELIADLDSADPALRRKAIWELGQRGSPHAIQPLVNLMMQSDSRQRSLILAALSEIGGRTMRPMGQALAISLQDPNPDVRKNAIRDLTRFYDAIAQMGPLLQQATSDPDPEVQATAQWALQQFQALRPALPADHLRLLNDLESSPNVPSRESSPESH